MLTLKYSHPHRSLLEDRTFIRGCLPIQRASGSSRGRKSRGQRIESARLDASSGEMKGAKDVELLELARDEADAALLSEGDEPPPRHTATAEHMPSKAPHA